MVQGRNIKVELIPGYKNKAVDCLSRLPFVTRKRNDNPLKDETHVCSSQVARTRGQQEITLLYKQLHYTVIVAATQPTSLWIVRTLPFELY